MAESRVELQNRKLDIFAAIHRLEQDYHDGLTEHDAYHALRVRLEVDAARVLERLESLPEQAGAARYVHVPHRALLSAAGLAVAAGAIILALTSALHLRAAGQSVTGGQPAPVSQPAAASARVRAAQRMVTRHPSNVDARLALGDAYLASGRPTLADHSYLAAMRLAPNRPEPATLHAMVLGSSGQTSRALTILHRVERAHPAFATAWLIDGLTSVHRQGGYAHAVVAWRRYLVLKPHTNMTGQVTMWIKQATRAVKATNG
jgi:cytochrome c-type biogenesis protein CcmH/NrfG